ncbi:hypothetical protein [Sphingomonas kyeonggiensis]|uniref:Uncharacterized protein n=1 Tax=Sphingomonas kyeonggiensis TaxID=1268553 RepID=A0A7W6JXP2_9SPHN|nr:hypothetical protein [Sphingomonas kyeonggiensis]MBB4101455.1 hypothetical protein [Sphingomonas kyeonggiensis]
MRLWRGAQHSAEHVIFALVRVVHPKGIRQAKVWLKKAESSAEALRKADQFDAIESAWLDFLIAAGTIYLKLESACPGTGPVNGWFGRVREERKLDPLLRYIHHARNSAQHGIEDSTDPDALEWRADLAGRAVVFRGEHPPISMEWESAAGGVISIDTFEKRRIVGLKAVFDRGNSFDPPTSHLGQSLPPFLEPINVASMGLKYLRDLVATAEFYSS